MTSPHFADQDIDDLPRTFRREKEAREREARERDAQARGEVFGPATAGPSGDFAPAHGHHTAKPVPAPAVVKALDVPFFSLMGFFIKAVFAAIPALIILGVLLWGAGEALQFYFPELVKLRILIDFPN